MHLSSIRQRTVAEKINPWRTTGKPLCRSLFFEKVADWIALISHSFLPASHEFSFNVQSKVVNLGRWLSYKTPL